MIQVDHLSKSYGQHQAVCDVSFDINQGQIIGLLGHNGAGKTTIMKLLSACAEPNSGCIHIDGIDVHRFPRHLHASLGYLPEHLPIYDEMCVMDYLCHVARLKKIKADQINVEVARVLKLTDLFDRADGKIAFLSRGYKQRVGVAQAILNRPKVLILDEPTNGLDPYQAEQMRILIQSIAQQATVIISTHIMQEVSMLCERVLILKKGRLLLDKKVSQLNESTVLVLKVNIEKEVLEKLFSPLKEVFSLLELVEKKQDYQIYHLHYQLPKDQRFNHQSLSNYVMQKVLSLDALSLFECYRLKRDLETVFKEVNQLDA